MRKRAISFLLSAVIVFGVFIGAVPEVSAASDMSASENCIALIKKLEGFVSKPYFDYNQWSVGYGTLCPEEDRVRYQTYGITTAEADALLRGYVDGFETKLNTFVDKYNLTLNQYQFDALISFTYNLGSDWMNNESTFRSAVLSGSTGNDFLFAITRWCTANNQILDSLIRRRLSEANLYLNGEYSTTVPSNYKYVLFDNVLEDAVNDVRIQAYDSTKTSVVRATASKTGYLFLGWYDDATGGTPVTTLDSQTAVSKLYAHWQEESSSAVGTAANYSYTVSDANGLVVRKEPAANGEEIDKLAANETVTITADYIDKEGTHWAKLSSDGWINMTAADSGNDASVQILDKPVIVTVIHSHVNIRSGAGTSYTKTGTANYGDQMAIAKTKVVNGETWGKFADGWICLTYTDYEMVIAEDSDDTATVTAAGTVNVDKLNVRAGTGTQYAAVGALHLGDKVEITQQKTVGAMRWGRIASGWICLDYVDLVPVADADSDSNSSAADEAATAKVVATGTVVNCSSLRVRSGAGTGNAQVGSLAQGTAVEIYEKITIGSQVWGRISSGWICLTGYVKLDSTDSGTGSESASESASSNASGTIGTVVNCSALNIRSGAGTGNAQVGKLTCGATVEILETVQADGATWGRISQGWIHMGYIQLNSASGNSTGTASSGTSSAMRGTVVGTDMLRIRSRAGVQNTNVGTLTRGTRVTILETTVVGKTTWGRISKGWISLYYVELDSKVAGTVKTVTADPLNIRSGAGTSNSKVGTYAQGTRVTILETKLVGNTLWGRTNKGWISLVYVE